MKHKLQFILAAPMLAILSPSVPALACSDLPNICAANEAHHQAQIDYWANPPWPDQNETYYDDGPSYSAEEWQAMAEEVRIRAEENRAKAEAELQERLKDPKFAAFWNGEWIEKEALTTNPGQFCTATFLYRGEGAMLIGPGGLYESAFLAFFGPQVPAPKEIRKLKATLEQSDEQPATLTTFNMALPWAKDYGMVLFQVPSIDALLGGILDKQAFRVSVEEKGVAGKYNRTIAELEWHSGLAARDILANCAKGKP
jgi:hypothetical protein